jgi:Type II secretion system (T2SS), protein E, N-terminal domain
MSPEDLRAVFYGVTLIALGVFAGYFFIKHVVPTLYRGARALDPRRQVLALAFVVLAALGLFPPWNFTFQAEHAARSRRPAPRALLFFPPSPRSGASNGVEIDLGRLGIEWLVVGAVASALLIVLRAWRPRLQEDGKRTGPPSASLVPEPTSRTVRPEVVQTLVKKEQRPPNLGPEYMGVTLVRLAKKTPDPKALALLGAKAARYFQVLPLEFIGDTVVVAWAHPAGNALVGDGVRFEMGNRDTHFVVADSTALREAIQRWYPESGPGVN